MKFTSSVAPNCRDDLAADAAFRKREIVIQMSKAKNKTLFPGIIV